MNSKFSRPHVKYETKTITYKDGPGNCYVYKIKLKVTANVRDIINNDGVGLDTFMLEVVDNQYFGYGQEIDMDFLHVHSTVATTVLAGSTNKDAFVSLDYGAKSTKKTGGLGVDVNLSLGVGPMGVALNWKSYGKVVNIDPPITFDVCKKVRGFKIPFKQILNDEEDQYSIEVKNNICLIQILIKPQA